MANFDCNICIHQNVCCAYGTTITECTNYFTADDVVPVVLCKDCKFADDSCSYGLLCVNPEGCLGRFVDESAFCSSGKRRCE